MPIARPSGRTLARHAARIAVLGFALCSCATGALSSPRRAPTLATWDRAADVSCTTANVAIDELVNPSSAAVEVTDLAAMITIGTRENAALAAIPPPPRQARTIATLLTLSRAGKPLEEKLISALRHARAITAIEQRAATLDNEYNALAIRLGARSCAINPQPGTLHISALPTA